MVPSLSVIPALADSSRLSVSISSAVRKRPPFPLGLEQACRCRDSCKYGWRRDVSVAPISPAVKYLLQGAAELTLLDLDSRFSSSSLCLADRRLRIRWYCFAFTYSGSSLSPSSGPASSASSILTSSSGILGALLVSAYRYIDGPG